MFLEVGHPTEWPASTFETYEQFGGIVEKSLFDNIVATNAYDVQRTLGRLGKPVDRRRWGSSSACDVNSFYSRKVNGIFIPAGILQQPFYSPKQQIARNYGSVGAICGHEMTHGFDGDFPQNSVQIVGQECMLFASHAASVYTHFLLFETNHSRGKVTQLVTLLCTVLFPWRVPGCVDCRLHHLPP